MDSLQIQLWMNLHPDASEGPGWYIFAGSIINGTTTPLIPAKRISFDTAKELGGKFEDSLQGQLKEGDIHPTKLIESGTQLIIEAIQKQLDEAEEQARKIKRLRQLLQETPASVTSSNQAQE